MLMFPGTQGYSEQAETLVSRYEAVPFEHKYRTLLHLLPSGPGVILDVGAGTGADAAWFASRGSRVLAVEPVERFRTAGMALHPSASIEWLEDGLPELSKVVDRGQTFDLILMAAVWMHLDEDERVSAMPRIARLLHPAGTVLMVLRHGPVPQGRRMFEVTAAETVALAAECGLQAVLSERGQSSQAENRAAGIEWTRIAFRYPHQVELGGRGSAA